MFRRAQGVLVSLGFYVLWAILVALAALAAFQAYAALLYVGLLIVENPAIRPAGWNTATISGLSRLLILVLGGLWLLMAAFLEGYLREGKREQRLWSRVLRAALVIGALYGTSYGALLLLS